ncbi:MAG: STAS domain-containing protein [Pseudonocardiaceae bacterium]|nr:MAG: STAS domain-containing protein [Pseudonocardiaceae bacterium]
MAGDGGKGAATNESRFRAGDPALDVDVRVDPGRDGLGGAVMTLRGDLDLVNRALLVAQLEAVTSRWRHVVVDLDGVSLLAACAVSELVRVRDRVARDGGTLVLRTGRGTPSAMVLGALRVAVVE